MFNSEGFEEAEGKSMEIKEFSEKTVEDFLKFIYAEELEMKNFTPELLLIAEKYDVKKLLEDCQKALEKALDSENAIEILKVGFLANQSSLMKTCRDFLYKNPLNFISEDWIQFVKDYPTACGVLRKLE